MNETVKNVVLDTDSQGLRQVLHYLLLFYTFLVLPLVVQILLNSLFQWWVYIVELHPLIHLVNDFYVIVVVRVVRADVTGDLCENK